MSFLSLAADLEIALMCSANVIPYYRDTQSRSDWLFTCMQVSSKDIRLFLPPSPSKYACRKNRVTHTDQNELYSYCDNQLYNYTLPNSFKGHDILVSSDYSTS
jgi:hypothetical protein